MKFITIENALQQLVAIRERFRGRISEYEQRAEPCSQCISPGQCCLDAHFVNVRVSRLEGEAIRNAIADLPSDLQMAVRERTVETIIRYKLDEALDTATSTYACPLFDKGSGCLVHDTAKPLPCVAHACYDREADLPPDMLLDEAELTIDALNRRTYGTAAPLTPIPLAIAGK